MKCIYMLFGLLTAALLMPSCTGGNEPGDFNHPADKVSLSISFHPEQQANGLRSNEIDQDVIDRESKIYSLAVLIFKSGSDVLDGKKFINRETTTITGAGFQDYKELDEIKEIELTSGTRDLFIIANAPDGHFNDVTNRASFHQKFEELSAQGMYDHPGGSGTNPGEPPIGGEEPDDRYTNLVMSQSFTGLSIIGADKHFMGYTGNGGIPLGQSGTAVNGDNPVELVRLVARVAIQSIVFDLPPSLTFETGISTNIYNHHVDTVFMINAKTRSSYFPEIDAFTKHIGFFGHGNDTGYNFLKNQPGTGIADGSNFAGYLYKPINFPDYDIENNQTPLWFYAFENHQSATYPTAFVIGVKYQYKNTQGGELKGKKAYYRVVVNPNGTNNGANHNFIKRNNQYGIIVTIKGLGSNTTDYPGPLRSIDLFSGQEVEGVMKVEETIGSNLFPWTGNVYK